LTSLAVADEDGIYYDDINNIRVLIAGHAYSYYNFVDPCKEHFKSAIDHQWDNLTARQNVSIISDSPQTSEAGK